MMIGTAKSISAQSLQNSMNGLKGLSTAENPNAPGYLDKNGAFPISPSKYLI